VGQWADASVTGVSLLQDCSNCIVTGIAANCKGSVGVCLEQFQRPLTETFDILKSSFLLFCPIQDLLRAFLALDSSQLEKVLHWGCSGCKVWDILAVLVSESQEGTQLGDNPRQLP